MIDHFERLARHPFCMGRLAEWLSAPAKKVEINDSKRVDVIIGRL